jgi:hypothetical protein
MPKNSLIYPEDFALPTRLGGSSTTNAGITLEAAVSQIAVQARDTALRQAHTRRILGQSVISQNRAKTGLLMPLHQVGTAIASPPFLGTAAYIPGTEGLQCFLFSNESFKRSTAKLPQEYVYGSVTGNSESGKFVGGETGTGLIGSSFDKLNYKKESVSRTGAKLTEPRLVGIGQMGTPLTGIIAGGADSLGVLKRDCHFYNHATDTVTVVANFLQRTRFAPHGGLSSQFNGYILGGSSSYFGANMIRSVERIPYAAGTTASINVSPDAPHSHWVHAAFSNPNKGYFAGGANSIPYGTNLDRITALTFSGETTALIAAKLAQPTMCSFGAGSSAAGYIFAGWNGDLTLVNKGVSKLDYATESTSIIGAQLLEQAWDRGAVSDYSPGFSYV